MCSPDNVIVCPVGEFFDCKSREKRCRSCTNAPSGATYVSAGIPATENDCDWTCDGCETVDIAWYMGPALSLSVLPWILGWCGFVLVSGLVAMMITKDRRLSIGMKCLLFTSFLFFDYAYMGSRFHWLLNSEDAQFKTMKTSEGEYIWIGPEFRSSSRSQRSQLGCNFSLAELEPAPEDACKVWWVSFNADMDFQGNNWIEGAAKFSVGFGLCIFAYVEIMVFCCILEFTREQESSSPASSPSASEEGEGEVFDSLSAEPSAEAAEEEGQEERAPEAQERETEEEGQEECSPESQEREAEDERQVQLAQELRVPSSTRGGAAITHYSTRGGAAITRNHARTFNLNPRSLSRSGGLTKFMCMLAAVASMRQTAQCVLLHTGCASYTHTHSPQLARESSKRPQRWGKTWLGLL